jgi:hypothetical protein
MNTARNKRSYLIGTARASAPTIFSQVDGVPPECYARKYKRSEVPELVDLLKSPRKPEDQYALYPRVLFKDYEVTNEGLFGSSAISNVRFLLHLTPPLSLTFDRF